MNTRENIRITQPKASIDSPMLLNVLTHPLLVLPVKRKNSRKLKTLVLEEEF